MIRRQEGTSSTNEVSTLYTTYSRTIEQYCLSNLYLQQPCAATCYAHCTVQLVHILLPQVCIFEHYFNLKNEIVIITEIIRIINNLYYKNYLQFTNTLKLPGLLKTPSIEFLLRYFGPIRRQQ